MITYDIVKARAAVRMTGDAIHALLIDREGLEYTEFWVRDADHGAVEFNRNLAHAVSEWINEGCLIRYTRIPYMG